MNKTMITRFFRKLYHYILSDEKRYWFYNLRKFRRIDLIKSQVLKTDKGNFSLRHFYAHKCIFVHVTKSAGTSLALSLFGEMPKHYTAQKYRVIYGKRDFNRFFKFTFVRNPWDRLYSSYSYLKDGGWNETDAEFSRKNLKNLKNFEDFVMNWLTNERLESHIHFWPQSKFVCDNRGRPIIDFIGYFETLNEDFNYVLNQLHLESRELKHTNKSQRASYIDVYTEEMKNKIANLYSQDINNFGYKFNDFNRVKIVDNSFEMLGIEG